jgi:two-component system, sensor histidine kinase YesM
MDKRQLNTEKWFYRMDKQKNRKRYMLAIVNLNLKQQLLLMIVTFTIMILFLQIYYYTRFYSVTESKDHTYTSTIISQIEEMINTFSQDIEDAALASSYSSVAQNILVSSDSDFWYQSKKRLDDILVGIRSTNKNILSIMLLDLNGRVAGPNKSDDYRIINELNKKFNFHTTESDQFTKPLYTKITSFTEMKGPLYAYVLPIFTFQKDSISKEKIGYCIIVFRANIMSNLLKSSSLFMIVDEENQIISSNDSSRSGEFFQQSTKDQIEEQGKEYKIDYLGKDMMAQYKRIEQLNWKIVSLTSINELTDEVRKIRNIGLIIGLTITILIMVMSLIFIRSVTKPIDKMITFMGTIGKNYNHQRLIMSNKNEIGKLADNVNIMLNAIESTNNQLIHANTSLFEMKLAKKEAELSALQAQINPHFLYNTLECIRSIGLAHNIPEILEISTSLAKILRYSIKVESYVLIENEINCIKSYLKIMSIRFNDKFNIMFEIDDTILPTKIPKMILQPIVENAIYHGLEQKRGRGNLSFKGYILNENTVRIEICDDGKGINELDLQKIQFYLKEKDQQSHTESTINRGIGLMNIHQRIQLAYGENYGITIYSKEQEGTKVILVIPRTT